MLQKIITGKRKKNKNLPIAHKMYLEKSLKGRLRLSPLKSDIRSVGQVPFLVAANFDVERLDV